VQPFFTLFLQHKLKKLSSIDNIRISDFSYHLPEEKVARYPLAERDSSNLLVWNSGLIKKDCFRNLTDYLPADTLLVFNNTRVIHARIYFQKITGANLEIFCLEPVEPADYQQAFQQTSRSSWKCMVGNAKKWKGEELRKTATIQGKTIEITARKTGQENNTWIIEFTWPPHYTFGEIIESSGILPIPPYLNRPTEPGDETAYQTVYAKTNGSVAAPTAGLHFTEDILSRLTKKNICRREITLHVGAGTFQPVKTETLGEHIMHQEQVIIPRTFIEELLQKPHKIIAVGTTSVRSLESMYWLGVKLKNESSWHEPLQVDQWESYHANQTISVHDALMQILHYLDRMNTPTLQFSTQMIIVPGYNFKLIEGMLTNFHQPQSTLLLLISAFLGNDWKKVYDYALQNDFRFLSYGDSNLYLK